MVTSKILNPERLKKIYRESSNIGIEADMLIISEFTSTSFSQQVKANSCGY